MDPFRLKEHILEMIAKGQEDDAASEASNDVPDATEVEFDAPQDKKVTLPKVFNKPIVAKDAMQVDGPAYPKDAVYEQDSIARPVDLEHTAPYSPGALAAAKLLMKEESFIPNAKYDVNAPRIGYSSEEHLNGAPVKMTDVVDEPEAYDMMMKRIVRDQNSIDNTRASNVGLMNDPNVEAVTLSRMYHQGPGVLLGSKKNPVPLLFRALMSNSRQEYADAVKKSSKDPSFKGRLNRESDIVSGKKK